MQRWNGFAVKDDASGEHVASASISVLDPGTATLLTEGIFSDNAASPTPKANPFTCDVNGYGFFYARSGLVDIQFAGTGITVAYTIPDVLLFDPLDGPSRYENVFVPFSAMELATVGQPLMAQLSGTSLWARTLAQGVERYLYFAAALPNAYLEDGDVDVYVHWAPATAASGNVAWELGYSWPNQDEQIAAAATLTAQPATPGVAHQTTITSLGTLTGTGKDIDSLLQCYIARDGDHASDDYAADAYLLGVSFRFLVNTLGSAAQLTK